MAKRWVARGERDADDIPRILAARSRSESGRMAPAQGLFLEEVIYPERFMDPGYVDSSHVDPGYPGPGIAPVIDQVTPPQGETP